MYKINESVTLKVTTANFGDVPKELFASDVWGGAVVISDYFRNNPDVVKGKNVIEVGAAGALPSMVALALGAKQVVVTTIQMSNYSSRFKISLQAIRFSVIDPITMFLDISGGI